MGSIQFHMHMHVCVRMRQALLYDEYDRARVPSGQDLHKGLACRALEQHANKAITLACALNQ